MRPLALRLRPRAGHARARGLLAACASLAAITLAAPRALAAPEAVTRAAGPKGLLAARVDLGAGIVRHRTCAAGPCALDAASPSLAIGLPVAQLGDPRDVVVEVVPVADGREVIHVRVPQRGTGASLRGRAWEAILAPGEAAPIFAGLTGLTAGEEGERTGTMVQIAPRDAATRFVVVGDIREDLRLCGQEATPLAPRVLDPATMTLRGATMQRLTREQRDAARKVVASARAGAPDPSFARLLVAAGTSSAAGGAPALTDGNTATAWSEARPGDGRGEFVVMRAPEEVPLARLAVVLTPDKPQPQGAAPRSFYLVSESATIAVVLPEDAWLHPGSSYDIPLADPIRSSCLALVLDEAYARGTAAPEVTIAELVAYSELDAKGATLERATAALAGGGPRAEAAAGVLKRAGAPGFDAVVTAYDALDGRGRALAIDVAAGAAACERTAPLFARAVGDADEEVARKGRGHLERCGRAAAPALADVVRGSDMVRRAAAATLLAALAPQAALEPLAAALGQGPPETRAAVRGALGQAAARAQAPAVAAIFRDERRSVEAELDLLRGARASLAAHAADVKRITDKLLAGAAPMRVRYLVLEPVAELARAGDPAAADRLRAMLASDPDGAVRARAATLAASAPSASPALAAAANDPEPRVREAALRALASSRDGAAVTAAALRVTGDGWPFVRIAAADLLAAAGPSPAADAALGKTLDDKAPRARAAAVAALARRRASSYAAAIQKRLEDADEDIDVRVAAARGLGTMCATASLERLTALARGAASPVADETRMAVGLAALAALGALHPPDLAARIAPLLAKDARAEVKRLAEAALREPGGCTRGGVVNRGP